MLTCTLCPRSVRLPQPPPSLRIGRQHVGGVANVRVVPMTVLPSLALRMARSCTWVGPCSDKRQIGVRLWHSYITWARQIRKFAYLVLHIRLLGFPTGHQRAATCQSPGARRVHRAMLVRSRLVRAMLVEDLLERFFCNIGFARKVRARSCPVGKD
jgi:hypothetical protein